MSPPPCPRCWRRHGFDVVHARSGEEALRGAAAREDATPFGVVLLDLGLPDQDGYEVCGKIRKLTSTPVIMVTARADVRSRIHGLNLGADDYVVKPYDTGELLARIHAVSRRAAPRRARTARPTSGPRSAGSTLRLGAVVIELPTRQVSASTVSPSQLTRKEFDLLALLAQRPGVVFRREQIISEVWRTSWEGTGRTLEVHVASLRAKLRHARADRDRTRRRLPARRAGATSRRADRQVACTHASSRCSSSCMAGVLLALGFPLAVEPGRRPAAARRRRPDRRHRALRGARPVRHRPHRARTTDERLRHPPGANSSATTPLYGIDAGVFYRDGRAMAAAPGGWRVPQEGEGARRVRRGAAGRRSHDPAAGLALAATAARRRLARSSATAMSSPSCSPTRPPDRCGPGSCSGWLLIAAGEFAAMLLAVGAALCV